MHEPSVKSWKHRLGLLPFEGCNELARELGLCLSALHVGKEKYLDSFRFGGEYDFCQKVLQIGFCLLDCDDRAWISVDRKGEEIMGYRVRIPLECFHEGIHLLNSLRAIFAELFLIPGAKKDESREAHQKNQNSCVCNEGLTTDFNSVFQNLFKPTTRNLVRCCFALPPPRHMDCDLVKRNLVMASSIPSQLFYWGWP